MSGSDAISPTAHYTGEVWRRHGLSHPWLATREGRVMYDALHPLMRVSGALGGPSLETYLLARHRAIDARLDDAIAHHGVTQVIEIAAGMSPRGWRWCNRYGDRLTYIEADLPEMAARKRAALRRIGSLSARHRVVELDALRAGGAGSLAELAAELDHDAGLAIITEGLLGYLSTEAVLDLWTRLAETLSAFPTGRYISDLHLGSATSPVVRGFRLGLSVFVRGRVHLHFDDAAQAQARLRACGFAAAGVRRAAEATELPPESRGSMAHILEASTT